MSFRVFSLLAAVVLLSRCAASSGPSTTLTANDEPAGSNCSNGGYRLSLSGSTTNAYVCNGETSAASVSVVNEPAGAQCASGGQKLTTNVGGATAISYVCNGAAGTSVIVVAEGIGTACPAGGLRITGSDGVAQFVCNGENGLDGSNGAAGTTVIATTPSSATCPYGGVELQVGNAAPIAVCNGATGQLLTVSAGASQVVAEDVASVVLSGSAANGATVQWQQLSGPPVTLLNATSLSASFTPPNVTADALLSFRLTATSGNVTESAETTVLVTRVNTPPTVSVSSSFTVAAGTLVTLTGVGSDADDQSLTYLWEQTAGSAATLSATTLPSVTFTAPALTAGASLTFSLTVSDGTAPVSDSVTITVNPLNVGPIVAAIPNLTAAAGNPFSFQITATDANPSEVLTYSVTPGSTPLPPWASLNSATGVISGLPKAHLASLTGLRVRVTDGAGVSTDSNAFALTALPGSPARLAFETRPIAEAMPGAKWPPFVVRIEDDFGNLTPDDESFVRVTNVSGALMQGTLAVRAIGGRAVFNDLSAAAGTLVFDVEASSRSTLRTRGVVVSVEWPTFAIGSTGTVGTGIQPYDLAIADVFGDGRPDLVVANLSSGTITTGIQTSPLGSFEPGPTLTTTGGHRSIAVGDLNADGLPDIVASRSSNAPLTVSIQSGGVFLLPVGVTGPTNGDPSDVKIADVNRDGRMDLVSANRLTHNVSVYLQSSVTRGAFPTRADFAAGPSGNPRAVAVADLNDDGWPDLAVLNEATQDVSVLIQNSSAPGTFLPQVAYNAGTDPAAIAVGDFDNDGLMDIAAANPGSARVNILRQDPTSPGSFLAGGDFAVANSGPNSLAVGDMNGDGQLDFVTGNASSISVCLHNSDGGLKFDTVIGVSTGGVLVRGIAVADLNGDGRLDIAATSPTQDRARVFLQTPRVPGSFAQKTTQTAGGAGAALADLDGDGRLDVASASYSTNQLFLTLQNPGLPGTFFSNAVISVSSVPIDVAAGDLNGDGLVDLVTANNGSNEVAVLLQDTFVTATFPAQQKYPTGAGPRAVRIADLNGDARPDLVVAAREADVVSVLLQSPSSPGVFLPRVDLPVGTHPLALAVGDLNGDGAPDIVVSNSGAATISLLIQDPASPGSFLAATTRAVQEDPRSIALGDLDDDGRTDIVVTNQRFSFPLQASFSVLLQSKAAPGTFPTITNVPTQNTAMDVTLADFNDDGRLDVAVTGADARHLQVWNQSTTGLGELLPPDVYTSTNAGSIAAADVDLDGRLDLVTVHSTLFRLYAGQ